MACHVMSCHVEQRNDLHRIVSYRLGEYNVKNDDAEDHDDDNDDGWRWLLDDKTLGICTTIAVDVCTLSSESIVQYVRRKYKYKFYNDDECKKYITFKRKK